MSFKKNLNSNFLCLYEAQNPKFVISPFLFHCIQHNKINVRAKCLFRQEIIIRQIKVVFLQFSAILWYFQTPFI